MPTRAGRTLPAQSERATSPKHPWRARGAAVRTYDGEAKAAGLGDQLLDLLAWNLYITQDQIRMGPLPTGEAGTRARQASTFFSAP